MSILVVGSVAFDTVETPFGRGVEVLGGSATHFSVSASFWSPVRLVAVVGEDFTDDHRAPLHERKVDLAGLATAKGRTFRWTGSYGDDLNVAKTLDTQLNVFADFRPVIPEAWRDTPVLFLANIDPDLQWDVLDQARGARLVAADTMNYWIDSKPDAVKKLLARVDVLLINDGEARLLTGEKNLVRAAAIVHGWGPRTVVVKRGEHGVVVFDRDLTFALPGFPLPAVLDPTGAGDAFAGGFLGYLASKGATPPLDLRRAAVVGSVMASYQVEDFSLERLRRLTDAEIKGRYRRFEELTRFPALD
ncbi:MAG TPA: PfkB family carbohydrate kinase [Candidatus Polarisedimenticolaceae bacterium]|nr:PfkB family carbohydrate kinase [Candidatus Polarisedimenticolaceae bacterium]